jgi:hypothetical protein
VLRCVVLWGGGEDNLCQALGDTNPRHVSLIRQHDNVRHGKVSQYSSSVMHAFKLLPQAQMQLPGPLSE